MAQSKRELYERKREHLRELAEAHETAAAGDVPSAADYPFILPEEADALLSWGDAYDGTKATATPNSNGEYVGDDRWGDSREPSTLRAWLLSVGQYAERAEGSLFDATADELNRLSQDMVDSGNSPGTVSTKQNCLIKFLQHYEGRTRADPDAIHVFDKQGSKIDPADMLSEGEFHAMRTAPEHPRDRALVNFFMYTGQRNTAVRTLRVKDVNLDEGTYRLNTEADGLKGADKVAMWNPLLGATKPIRDWLNHHPAPEDGDAYLFTERHDHRERDPYSTISDDTVNWVLRNAAERAAEEHPAIENKPTHSHAMRHNFVTMCKLRYDMDNDTIKRLIRHKPDSTVMETTYAHLSDADYIQKAEQAFGIREEDDSTEAFDHSPEFCDVCDEPLQRGAKACPACGTLYAPDARSAQSDMQADAESAIVEVDNEAEARIVQSVLEDLREEPGDYLGED